MVYNRGIRARIVNIEAYRSHHRNRITFLLLTLALGASTPGCAARAFDQLMRSWQGHTLDDLFRTWGPPNYLYSDGAGGQIAVYVPAPASGTTRSGAASERLREAATLGVYQPRMTDAWPIFRMFFADGTTRVVRTQWRGRWECCSR
jgi:hypothetical protein